MLLYTVLSLLIFLEGSYGEASKACNGENLGKAGNEASCYECGLSKLSIAEGNTPFFNKRNASVGDFPWQVILYRNHTDVGWSLVCGGTLITPQVVITAAYCVEKRDIRVALGKTTAMWNVTDPTEIRPEIRTIIVHPNYRGSTTNSRYEIALLILNNKVSLSDNVMPVCLDYDHNILPPHQRDDLGYMAGFGNQYNIIKTKTLQYTRDKILSNTECSETILTVNNTLTYQLDKGFFCFGNGTVDPIAIGNGGDGLTVIHQGIHYLTGVASLEVKRFNGLSHKYDYTLGIANNVTHYMDWIKTNLPLE